MSRASMWVRFPDGDVRYGLYCGTSDVAWSRLHGSLDAAWEAYDSSDPDDEPEGAVEVKIATDYGGGFRWTGKATKEWITAGWDVYEAEGYEDGLPEWVPRG